jgi:signal peptidase I
VADIGPSERVALSGGILWGEEILKSGCELRMATVGGRMLPAIRGGDIVIVRPAGVSDVTIGDVVVFRQADMLVAHRLVRKFGTNGAAVLVTKGDFRPRPDEPLSADKVLGKVITIERNGRTRNLTRPLPKTTAWLCAHVIPALPWFLPLLRTLRSAVRRAFGR